MMEKTKKQPYLTEKVVFGKHPYWRPGDDSTVYYVDESRGIRKLLIDRDGYMVVFPGIVPEPFWMKEVGLKALVPQIRFRSSFRERRDGGWIFFWQLQPDGWYWADSDGFGGESDPEVTLYTILDEQGNYTGPFRIYQYGSRIYPLEKFRDGVYRVHEKALAQLKAGEYLQHSIYGGFLPYHAIVAPNLDREYAIFTRKEAEEYWQDPELSGRLKEIAQALLEKEGTLSSYIPWNQRWMVHSAMTLFWIVTGEEIFRLVLEKFFEGKPEPQTQAYMNRKEEK